MKEARAAAEAAMSAKSVALLAAPPMEAKVLTGGFLERRAVANSARLVDVEGVISRV